MFYGNAHLTPGMLEMAHLIGLNSLGRRLIVLFLSVNTASHSSTSNLSAEH